MASRVRDLLKLSAIIAVAFGLGLTFAHVFDIPRPGQAQSRAPAAVPVQSAPQAPGGGRADGPPASFADIADRVNRSVVFIQTAARQQARQDPSVPPEFQDFFRRFQGQGPRIRQGSGSGFIVTRDGYILTNNHVVEDADRVTVRLLDNREFQARVVGRDANTDVAVIKIEATDLPAVTFGNSDQTRIGDWVLAVGNPLGFTFTVTAGIISAKGRALAGLRDQNANYSIQDFIQTDAAINPGNSGGPLVDMSGNVIGVNSAIASQTGYYSGYGFAIPINLARQVMNDLIATGRVSRSVLGIRIGEITPNAAAYVGLDSIRGVVVQGFPDGASPARDAGLQVGDVIVTLNDSVVGHVSQLQQMVGFRRPGEAVRVGVVRREGERTNVRRTYQVRLMQADTEETPRVAARETAPGAGEKSAPMEGRLGVRVEDLPAEVATRNRIPADYRGVVVSDVEEGGPAWQQLFAPSQGGPEVITHVNQTRVRTVEEFQRAVRAVGRGDVVRLRVYNVQGQLERVVFVRTRS
jgi:serine protease Do